MSEGISASDGALYKDPKAPVEARIADLMQRMTPAEKVAQLQCIFSKKRQVFDDNGMFDPDKADELFPDGFGGFGRPADGTGLAAPEGERPKGRGVRDTVKLVNAVQKWASERTRLGIPALMHEEGLHGYAAPETTSFPQVIALASTWNTKLVEEVFTAVGREIRARGVHEVLSPVVDIVRDPRWGRTEECFGEDPYLVTRMSVAAVRGFQGEALPLAPDRVFATLKHMTGHGWPENGNNVGPANLGERALRTSFLPPFKAAIEEANALCVMASYNEIDGVPSHANTWLLKDLLREEWGFKGAVVSDYFAIAQLETVHHIEPDLSSAAIRALSAGVTMDLPNGTDFETLLKSHQEGRVSMDAIEGAVAQVLRVKFLAGLFENPFADADAAAAATNRPEAKALATRAARDSVILLKNDGVLPLDAGRIESLAVIGPNADAVLLGGYSGDPLQSVTMLKGIAAKLGDKVRIVHAEGCRITESDEWRFDRVEKADAKENAERIEEAVKIAQGADHIVLFLGGNPQTCREGWAPNHLGDRDSLDLLGEQMDLFNAMKALGKPIVVVLLNGRPLATPELAEEANALIEGWYLGENGGSAMADILFGDANPGGKLPLSVPRSVGQLPIFYDKKPSARRGYLFNAAEPLFPFGFGLSYTTFEVGAPRLSSARIAPGQSVRVEVEVTNTGARAGDEVVQLYVHDLVASVTVPVQVLRGFERVTLRPGETRTVGFTLGPEDLALWNGEMKHVVEPGEFEIMAGNSSVDLKSTMLSVAARS